MIVNRYLGEPQDFVKNWHDFKKEFGKRHILQKIHDNLERFTACQFVDCGGEDRIEYCTLPEIGTTIPVNYKIDASADFVATQWQILGYNKSLPERIKYKNGDNVIYVSVFTGGYTQRLAAGSDVFEDKYTNEPIGKLTGVSPQNATYSGNEIEGTCHTYGNNVPYDAPRTVYFDGDAYSFAGWNVTIAAKNSLVVKNPTQPELVYKWSNFDPNLNCWYYAAARDWLNSMEAVDNSVWLESSQITELSGTIPGLLSRIEQTHIDVMQMTVNTQFLYTGQPYQTIDYFWLFGNGEINNTGLSGESFILLDAGSDTSIYKDLFPDSTNLGDTNQHLLRTSMNPETGGDTTEYTGYWLKSGAYGYTNVEGVVAFGQEDSYTYAYPYLNQINDFFGLIPVCAIG